MEEDRKEPDMLNRKSNWVLVGILGLALWSAAYGQDWEADAEAGIKAYEQGHYTEAEKLWVAALKEAEKFGPQDPRIATIKKAATPIIPIPETTIGKARCNRPSKTPLKIPNRAPKLNA